MKTTLNQIEYKELNRLFIESLLREAGWVRRSEADARAAAGYDAGVADAAAAARPDAWSAAERAKQDDFFRKALEESK